MNSLFIPLIEAAFPGGLSNFLDQSVYVDRLLHEVHRAFFHNLDRGLNAALASEYDD